MRKRYALAVAALAACVVGPASVALAESGRAAPAASGDYIVVFKAGTAAAASDAAIGQARAAGGSVRFRYGNVLNGFAANLPPQALNGLSRNPNVELIEADQVVTADVTTQTPSPSWGLDRIDQRDRPLGNSYAYTSTGGGVTAYVIDTGIDVANRDFGGRARVGADFVGDGQNGADCNGHGTHVAGTVGGAAYGVAKSVNLVAVRVLNCAGSGTTSGVIAGVDWVAGAAKPAVANMSLGGGASFALDSAVTNAINAGVVFSVAAGNSNQDACRTSPARAAAAITVGATTSSDARASYSNYGSCLDLFAPGSAITSDWLGGGTNTISGTSMATPHVTGAAARYLAAHPGSTAGQVRNAIVAATTLNRVTSAGLNSPNRLLFADPAS